MNLRQLTITTLLLTNTIHNTAEIKANTKDQLLDVYTETETPQKTNSKETKEYYEIPVSTANIKTIKDIDIPRDTDVVFSRSTNDLKDTPLFMKGIPRHIGEFLGYKQYTTILKEYNMGKKVTNITELSEVKFPLIYDGLKDKVSKNLSERLTDQKFDAYQDSLQNIQDAIIVDTDTNGKTFLSYYKGDTLILCTYVSTGAPGHNTPKGVYQRGVKSSYRRSKKYNNAPMAYALHVVDGIFLHQGYTDGTRLSHGCVRVPGLYQEFLFNHVTPGTKIILL